MTAAQLEEKLAPVRRELTAAVQLFGPLLQHQTAELSRLRAGFSQASEALAARETQLTQTQANLANVGAGFTQAMQFLAEREAQLARTWTQLAQAQTDLIQAQVDLTQTRDYLIQMRAELSAVNSELATVRAHWVWRFVRMLSMHRKELA